MKSIKAQRKDNSAKTKGRSILFVFATCSVVFLVFTSGCGNKFFDPTQVGRFRPVPAVNVILDSLGVAEEPDVAWAGGEEPRPGDTVVMETDYVFRSGDIVRVAIYELLNEGITMINDYVVTETGKISIPDVGVVEAAGLTETQLEEEIRQILSPSILKDPSVTVTLMTSQQRTFSILGNGIPGPGRYTIPRYDFRLMDALATAGGQNQFNVSYIYVSRSASNGGTSKETFDSNLGIEILEPTEKVPDMGVQNGANAEMLELLEPRAQGQQGRQRRGNDVVIASSEMARIGDLGSRRRPAGYASADNLGGLLTGDARVSDGRGGTVIGEPIVGNEPVTSLVNEVEPALEAETPDTAPLLQQTEEEDQVSVADILKTLAARSQQNETTAPAVSRPGTTVQSVPGKVSAVELPGPKTNLTVGNVPKPQVSDQAGELDSILRTLGDRQRSARMDDRVSVGTIEGPAGPDIGAGAGRLDEPGSVESILKSLEARSGQAEPSEQAEWQNVLESFAEPEPVETKPEEDMDLDELLRSFAEPGTDVGEPGVAAPDTGMRDIGVRIDEQVRPDDVKVDVNVPEVGEGPWIGPEDVGISLTPGVTEESVPEVVETPGRIEWVFQDGKWVPMQIGTPSVVKPVIPVEPELEAPGAGVEAPSGTMDWGVGATSRLLKIPADRLMAGDPRYNIVIKPGDTIYVPVDVIGEFCIMGNVVRQGYIPITGRPLNLKMAIAAAGGLGPLAWPKRVEVVRRIGRKKEEVVMVDLDKIYSGELPDFFIKPNDLINVGTHATARWRAVLRNSFRSSWGFGFVYDRNFADRDYYNSPWPF